MTFLRYTMAFVLLGSIGFLLLGAAQEGGALRIVVQEGQAAVNVLASNSAVSPVVEVRDKNDKPVVGARVFFVLPKEGPRALFADGGNSVSVATGRDGRAKAAAMRPVGIGKFEIAIQADYRGQIASSTITQTNVETTAGVESTPAPLAGQGAAALRIQVLEGDDGVNIIDKGTAVTSVVRIVDKNDLPVAGVAVAVAVLATRGGSKADFSNNKNTITVTTDADGIAKVTELRPAGKGSFQVQIQINAYGQIVTRTVTQANYTTELAALNAGKMPGSSKGDIAVSDTSQNASPQIKVVGADTGKNIIKGDSGTTPTVAVTDAAGAPLSGVRVAFVVQSAKNLAQFANGDTYVIVTTDANGTAVALQLHPLGKGAYSIKVLVAYRGEVFTASVPQVNYATLAEAQKANGGAGNSGSNTGLTATGGSKLIPVLVVIGGAAGIASAVCNATKDKCGSANNSSATSTSSAPSCNASSLRSQLQSQLQSLLPLCNVSGSGNTAAQTQIQATWTQLCACVGFPAPTSGGMALATLDMCINTFSPNGYTPAYVAQTACTNN